MQHHSYSASVVLRTNFTKKDGTNPLLLRIIINRKTVDFSLNLSVLPEHFNRQLQTVKIPNKKEESEGVNILLQHYRAKASTIFVNHKLMDLPLTIKQFKYEFENEMARYSFIDFMIKEIEHEAIIMKATTIKAYKQTIYWLNLFFKNGLMFSELTVENMDAFHRFQVKNKLKPNTIHKHKKNILKFINIAIAKGYKLQSPYKILKINKVESPKDSLTKKQVVSLMELYDGGKLPAHLQNVLGMFLFSCTCGGLRFSDLIKLHEDSIIENTLVYIPQKLERFNRVVKIPIPEYARNYFQNERGKLFHPISNVNANAYLKIIQRLANIKLNLTTHMARHTFATLFLEADGEPYTLMDIMGISKYDTIKVYVHIAQNRKKELMKRYANFISLPIIDNN